MNTRSIISISLAATVLASSCNSSYEASGGVTGAIIGSHVGETIGFLSGSGRYRGESAALGSLIGTGVGTILGVGIARQTERNIRKGYEADSYSEERYGSDDYQIGGGATYEGSDQGYSFSSNLNMSDISYTDTDGDGYLSKNEVIEIAAKIENTSDHPLRNVSISLTTYNEKYCAVSPSLTIDLRPGEKTIYTGRIFCKKSKRGRKATFSLSATSQGLSSARKSFSIYMR